MLFLRLVGNKAVSCKTRECEAAWLLPPVPAALALCALFLCRHCVAAALWTCRALRCTSLSQFPHHFRKDRCAPISTLPLPPQRQHPLGMLHAAHDPMRRNQRVFGRTPALHPAPHSSPRKKRRLTAHLRPLFRPPSETSHLPDPFLSLLRDPYSAESAARERGVCPCDGHEERGVRHFVAEDVTLLAPEEDMPSPSCLRGPDRVLRGRCAEALFAVAGELALSRKNLTRYPPLAVAAILHDK